MLSIRTDQLKTMSLEKQRLFERQMIDHLAETYPNQIKNRGLDSVKLKAFVEEGIFRSRSWGITSTAGIREYLDCRMIFGSGFDLEGSCSWAAELLADEELSGQEKAEGLAWHLTFEVNWEEHPDG